MRYRRFWPSCAIWQVFKPIFGHKKKLKKLFKLKILFFSNSNEVDIGAPNTRVGTIRYMAPEILNQTVNAASFESFKQVKFATGSFSTVTFYMYVIQICCLYFQNVH